MTELYDRFFSWLLHLSVRHLVNWLDVIAKGTSEDATIILNSDGSSYIRLHDPKSLVIREITLDAPICLANTLVRPKVFAAAYQDAHRTFPAAMMNRRRTDPKPTEPEDIHAEPLSIFVDPEGTQYFVDNRLGELLPVATWNEAKEMAARYPGNVAIASHNGITFRAFRPQQLGMPEAK
jgi:hypothetical protein